ncbi:MAG TPA: carbon starvation CstA family protein, partial [Kofleriaceae bacterium]|nr:carbon starvation CstA family protein [Kofleriaceae bacterium]
MSLTLALALAIAGLFLGYRFYGGFIARQFRLDPAATTPAVARADGVDFVPTKRFYLLGQHFSAISAAGPIAGPILACQQFGWLPCLLWIVLGVIFIGAVHDFSTLVASVRHDARSIAEVVRAYLGKPAFYAIMAFIWLALVYVLLAFIDVTASTFATAPIRETGVMAGIDPGGAVALGATLYLGLAVVMGFVDRLLKPPLWLQTVIFVPATIGCIWLGTQLSTSLQLGWSAWAILIVVYCFVASLTPVWALLQPRGYLGGFFLYIALAVGVIGITFGGFDIQQSFYKGFDAGGANGLLVPFLFVTIACGACSGFHGLVCSGTTSKQISKEPH